MSAEADATSPGATNQSALGVPAPPPTEARFGEADILPSRA